MNWYESQVKSGCCRILRINVSVTGNATEANNRLIDVRMDLPVLKKAPTISNRQSKRLTFDVDRGKRKAIAKEFSKLEVHSPIGMENSATSLTSVIFTALTHNTSPIVQKRITMTNSYTTGNRFQNDQLIRFNQPVVLS